MFGNQPVTVKCAFMWTWWTAGMMDDSVTQLAWLDWRSTGTDRSTSSLWKEPQRGQQLFARHLLSHCVLEGFFIHSFCWGPTGGQLWSLLMLMSVKHLCLHVFLQLILEFLQKTPKPCREETPSLERHTGEWTLPLLMTGCHVPSH